MAKRATNIPTFNPKDTLKSIRENSLNPVITRLNTVETTISSDIIPVMKDTYKNVTFNKTNSTLTFVKVGNAGEPVTYPNTDIDLSSIVPVYAGIDVKGDTGEQKSIHKLEFTSAKVTKDVASEYTKVEYEWDKIIPQFQSKQTAKITGQTDFDYTSFEISGEGKDIFHKHVNPDGTIALTVNMPKIPEAQTALVDNRPIPTPPTPYKPFTKIKITGNVGGSIITSDGELQIDLPEGGGVTPFATGNFKGFFDNISDLDQIPASQLQADRSSAYVRTDIKGVVIYTLYMYKGPAATLDKRWVPVTNRPPLIFNDNPSQAIFSVKPNSAISVSSDGQLNLDGLQNTGTTDGNFLGVYQTLDDIKAIKDPIINKSYAMLVNTKGHGLLPYMYLNDGTKQGWILAPSLGHLMGIGLGTTIDSYKPIYGLKVPGGVVTSQGVMDFTKARTQGTIKTVVDNKTFGRVTNEVRHVRYLNTGSFVDMRPGRDIVEIFNPQRVVEKFDQPWRENHETPDYLGNIFYDNETGRWMGMTDKNIDPTKEPKWTPIAHRNMSLDVADQTYRYPRETPTVVIDATGDSDRWAYSGTTYVDASDPTIPSDIDPKCGGFIKTDVKEDPTAAPGKGIRIQTFTADDGSGRTFARAIDRDTSTPEKVAWKPWVRTNYSIQDFKDHEVDPGAHNTTHRFFRTTMVDFVWSQGPSDGILDRTHVYTFTDSYGHSHKSDKPGSIPYSGNFRMGMSVHFEGYRESPNSLPKGSWVITLIKNAKATGAETDIGAWEHKHDVTGAKEFKHFQFMQENISFDTDDQVKVKMEWIPATGTTSSDLTTAAPMLRIMGTRSMIILEDMNTVSATLVGNALTKFLGRTLDRGNVATHTHFTGADESEDKTVRTYAEKIDSHFVNMTPKT